LLKNQYEKKSPFLAFIAIFLGVMAYKQFDFENLRFKTGAAYMYLITSLAAAYFYFKPLKENE
jgi:hypothetical protein